MATYKAGKRHRPPTHPGTVIRTGIRGLRLTIAEAAASMGVEASELRGVLNGAPIKRDMAQRVSRLFGNRSTMLWLRMQADCDAWKAKEAA